MEKIKITLKYNPYTLVGTEFRTETNRYDNILLPSLKMRRLQEWLEPYEIYG